MTKHDNVSREGIMKATEFVKKFGWVKTKSVLSEALKYRLTDKFTYNTLEEQWDLYVDDLKRLVESHELVESIGGIEKAILHLITTDRRLGYTHIYLHSNGRYCWLDDYVDYIPDHAISIKSAIKAIADVEACQ